MDTQVSVIDTVVTKPGRAREFVDRYLREYAPGARERGMTLERIVVSPPVWFPDAANTITATWVLDGAAGWWAMTWKGRGDEQVRRWWSDAADLIVERSRVTGAAAVDVDGLCGMEGPGAVVEPGAALEPGAAEGVGVAVKVGVADRFTDVEVAAVADGPAAAEGIRTAGGAGAAEETGVGSAADGRIAAEGVPARAVTRLVQLSSGAAEDVVGPLRSEVRRAAVGAHRVLVEPTLPGTRNGGDVLVHLRFADAADWAACAERVDAVIAAVGADHVDGVEYGGGTGGFAEPRRAGGVYRTLLLRVEPETPEAVVAEFEADLLRMPQYISSIRSWRLSRVSRATGSSAWTHVWEQEFSDLDGLTGPYLMHPIHWAHVDRWFDPECPDLIVADRICHSFCAATGFVLD